MEWELRDELTSSVSKEASDADRARISELEESEAQLRIEASKYDPCFQCGDDGWGPVRIQTEIAEVVCARVGCGRYRTWRKCRWRLSRHGSSPERRKWKPCGDKF